MAINYEPVGWDTTKHFNPTNMNHMDGGIKAACDKVDEHDSEIAEINSNFSELGTGTFYGWCILRVQGGVGYLYITDTNIKSTDTIAFNDNLEIVGVVYKQLSSIVVKNRNGGFLVTITFDGMDNYNNSLVGFKYTVSR